MAKKLQLRRGTTSQHSSFTGAVGEVTVDTDKKVVVVHDGSTAGGVPLATAADITGKQASDAQLTELATMGATTAEALADLTQAEVQILDDATVTTTELNTLDGFTGDKDDLNYAKDLRATGVTATEYDYLDGVTSAIQTQLDTKSALTGDNTWTGSQRGAIETEALTGSGDTRTLTLDFNTGNNFYVDLVGSVTSVAISNPTVGQSGSIIFNQSVGNKTVGGWNGAFKFSGGTAPTITVTAGKFDRIDYFIYTTSHIQVVWSGNY